jgi:DNA-binding XRE family transcriptional regulator
MEMASRIKILQITSKNIESLRRKLKYEEERLIEELVEWRKEKSMTQTALAEKFGITKAYLSDIERGRRGLSQNILEKILEII